MKIKIGSIYIYITTHRMKRRGSRDNPCRNNRDKLLRMKHNRWKENGGICEECRQKFVEGNLEIHHIIPVCKRPELVASKHNIMIVCHRCHQHLHGK